MYARVARFDGQTAESIEKTLDAIKQNDGPPPGVPGKGFMVLSDKDKGVSLAISFFDSEEDMKTGDAALNEMSPPSDATMGKRVSVEMYEVGAKLGPALGD